MSRREMSKGLIAVIKAIECRSSGPSLSSSDYEDISEGWSASDNDRNWWARVNYALCDVAINFGLHIVSPSSSRWSIVLTSPRENLHKATIGFDAIQMPRFSRFTELFVGKCKSSYKILLTFETASQLKSRQTNRWENKSNARSLRKWVESGALHIVMSRRLRRSLCWLRKRILRNIFRRHSAIRSYAIVSTGFVWIHQALSADERGCTDMKAHDISFETIFISGDFSSHFMSSACHHFQSLPNESIPAIQLRLLSRTTRQVNKHLLYITFLIDFRQKKKQ